MQICFSYKSDSVAFDFKIIVFICLNIFMLPMVYVNGYGIKIKRLKHIYGFSYDISKTAGVRGQCFGWDCEANIS